MDKRAAFSRACSFLNFRPAARWLAQAVAAISSLVLPVAIFLVGLVVEVASRGDRPPSWMVLSLGLGVTPASIEVVVGLTLVAFLAGLMFLILRFAMYELAIRTATEAGLRLHRAVYHQTLRIGALAVRPPDASSLVHRQVDVLRDALLAWQLGNRPTLVLLFVLVLQGFFINFWVAVVGGLGASLLLVLAAGLAVVRQRRLTQITQTTTAQQAALLESLTFLRLTKAHATEHFQQTRTEATLTALAEADQQRDETASRFRFSVWFALLVTGGVLLLVAGLQLVQGRLSMPELVMLTAVAASAYWPVRDWMEQSRRVLAGAEAAVVIFRFLDQPGDVTQTVGADALPRLARRIECDNVSLREPGGTRLLLEHFNLALPAGQCLALVGTDDAEKYALIYLLARLLDPSTGEIRFDEHNLRSVTLDSLRKQLGIVLGQTLVSSDTVAANIAGGDPGVPMPRILEAAKLTHAHQFIGRLPRGYDTLIGEQGHALKPGERFRIALARALLRNPALLIIEEPPAALLDDDTRSLLEDTYARALSGRTVIFLPHREETIALCGSVLVLHRGRVEALGAHLDLMKQSAVYRHLFYQEFNEFARRQA